VWKRLLKGWQGRTQMKKQKSNPKKLKGDTGCYDCGWTGDNIDEETGEPLCPKCGSDNLFDRRKEDK
jgi:Zn finger protein HypA/HybF involved in hydrogenase expression